MPGKFAEVVSGIPMITNSALMLKRRNKYGAKKCEADGFKFDSLAEREEYFRLKLRLRAGEIKNLAIHPEFPLVVGGGGRTEEKIGAYEADFAYYDLLLDHCVVVDTKGFKTPLYRWKAKHFKAQYGYAITEISARRRARRAA